jgi:hypothetical protein
MRSSRKKFVLQFLAWGYAFDFVTRFLLSQPPRTLGISPDQTPWQRLASTLLLPARTVLVGPIIALQQDPDPPPPFRGILLAVYWSGLALGIHYVLSRKKARS